MSDRSFYRAREFEDFRGSFNQDDESKQTFWDDRVQLDLIVTRDHRPYHYREAKGFVYLNVIRNDYINAALSVSNNRLFDFRARGFLTGAVVFIMISAGRFGFNLKSAISSVITPTLILMRQASCMQPGSWKVILHWRS